jgi:hypothetical protein
MDAVKECKSFASLSGFDGCWAFNPALFAGSLETLDFSCSDLVLNELIVAVAHLLPRSAATLTYLDLRCVVNFRRCTLHFFSPITFHLNVVVDPII